MEDREDFSIRPDDIVTLTMMNDIFEIQYQEKVNNQSNILKLDSDRYIVKSTGEIKEYEHTEMRSQSENSLKQTFKKLRYLINANFKGGKNELWATLTFKDTYLARNPAEIYLEYNKFIKRLCYKLDEKIEYLAILEPHGLKDNDLNSWHGFHLHVLFKSYKSVLYIPYRDFEKIWGLGMARVERLTNIDNIGAYLSAYLTNVELEENSSGEKTDKKYVKGSRLWLYPKGIRIYRKSKGLAYPKRVKMPYKSARELIGQVAPHYTKTYKIENEDFENTIVFEQYNRKRRKCYDSNNHQE